jgi:predicted transcriptional regulator
LPKLSRLEHQIMDALWNRGASSVREVQETFPEKDRPAYTTVQTDGLPLEEKGAVRRTKKIGNAHIFEAVVSRSSAQRRLIDELLAFFGGSSQPVVAHLIESGNLTLDDVKDAEQLLLKLKASKSGKSGKQFEVGADDERHPRRTLGSSVAINRLRGRCRVVDAGVPSQPRARAALAVAHGVAEVWRSRSRRCCG